MERRFVDEYLVDLNATQAAIRAGYSPVCARTLAHEVKSKERVAQAIKKAMADRSRRTGISSDRVLRELARVAFSDMKTFAKWGPSGISLKPSEDMSEDDSACIQELSESVTKDGGSTRFKLHDKRPALEMLARHLGLFEKDNDQKALKAVEDAKEIQKLTDDELISAIEGELESLKAKRGAKESG